MDKMLMKKKKKMKKTNNYNKVELEQLAAAAKIKKKPAAHHVKVVYISNPMKVNTSASEFRALVQELTGQDSDMPTHLAPSNSRFTDDVQISVGGTSTGTATGTHQEQELEEIFLPNYHEMNHTTVAGITISDNEIMSRESDNLSFETFDVDDDDAMLIMPHEMLPNNFFPSSAAVAGTAPYIV